MHKRIEMWLAVSCMMLTMGCAANVIIRPNVSEIYQDADQVICAAGCPELGADEQGMVRQSVYELLYYLQARFGREAYQELLRQIVSGVKPSLAVLRVYGKSLYLVGVNLFRELTAANQPLSGPWLTRVCGMYTLHYQSGSMAERDINQIEWLLGRYDRQLNEWWIHSSGQAAALQRNLAAMDGQTVDIWLPGDTAGVKALFQNSHSTAESQFGFRAQGPDLPVKLYARMTFKYQGMITLVVLLHEMTHIWQIIMMLPPEMLHPQLDPKQDIRAQLQKQIEPLSRLGGGWLGEGLAEYLSENGSLLRRAGLFADVDEEIRQQHPSPMGERVWEMLQQQIKSHNDQERVLAYQMAHSCCRYLVQTYGWDATLRLITTPGGENDFQTILGKPRIQIMREWQEQLFERQAL